MKRVLASREGLQGRTTAQGLELEVNPGAGLRRLGLRIDADGLPFTLDDLFVALPSVKALGRWVRVRYQGIDVTVPVLDLGPWFPFRDYEGDADYVFGSARPRAESMKGKPREGDRHALPINGAGIDLADGVVRAFGIEPAEWGVREVEWCFLDPALRAAA